MFNIHAQGRKSAGEPIGSEHVLNDQPYMDKEEAYEVMIDIIDSIESRSYISVTHRSFVMIAFITWLDGSYTTYRVKHV